MTILFRRSSPRTYAIETRRPHHPDVLMDPAPGYDARLPHDLVHFIVEAELGLTRGVFGQLAAGGHAGSFRKFVEPAPDTRAAKRRRKAADRLGEKLAREGRDEATFSEHAGLVCWARWLARSSDPADRVRAAEMTPSVARVLDSATDDQREALNDAAIDRVCARFDVVSRQWRSLGVGGTLPLDWPLAS